MAFRHSRRPDVELLSDHHTAGGERNRSVKPRATPEPKVPKSSTKPMKSTKNKAAGVAAKPPRTIPPATFKHFSAYVCDVERAEKQRNEVLKEIQEKFYEPKANWQPGDATVQGFYGMSKMTILGTNWIRLLGSYYIKSASSPWTDGHQARELQESLGEEAVETEDGFLKLLSESTNNDEKKEIDDVGDDKASQPYSRDFTKRIVPDPLYCKLMVVVDGMFQSDPNLSAGMDLNRHPYCVDNPQYPRHTMTVPNYLYHLLTPMQFAKLRPDEEIWLRCTGINEKVVEDERNPEHWRKVLLFPKYQVFKGKPFMNQSKFSMEKYYRDFTNAQEIGVYLHASYSPFLEIIAPWFLDRNQGDRLINGEEFYDPAPVGQESKYHGIIYPPSYSPNLMMKLIHEEIMKESETIAISALEKSSKAGDGDVVMKNALEETLTQKHPLMTHSIDGGLEDELEEDKNEE